MAIVLRLIGVGCFLWTAITQNVSINDVMQSVVLMLLCFVASRILDELDSIAAHTKKQDSALTKLLQSTPNKNTRKSDDLAPHAPNWAEIKPRPSEPEKDSGYEQRLARRWRYMPKKRA